MWILVRMYCIHWNSVGVVQMVSKTISNKNIRLEPCHLCWTSLTRIRNIRGHIVIPHIMSKNRWCMRFHITWKWEVIGLYRVIMELQLYHWIVFLEYSNLVWAPNWGMTYNTLEVSSTHRHLIFFFSTFQTTFKCVVHYRFLCWKPVLDYWMNDCLMVQVKKEVLEKLGLSTSLGIDALIWIVLISSEVLISWRLNQFSLLNTREGL